MSDFGPHFAAGSTIGFVGVGISILMTTEHSMVSVLAPLVAGIAGALNPDMDIKSKSSTVMYFLFLCLGAYLMFIGNYYMAFAIMVYSIIPQFCKHRGFIHSFIFGLIATGVLYLISIYLFNFTTILTAIVCGTYFAGFLSHKILDEL